MTIAEAMRLAELLTESDSAALDTALLLTEVLQVPRAYLYTWPERSLTSEQELAFRALLARRKAGEPVAYLLRRREFWSLSLQVNQSTLIPRPDTEILVSRALELIHGWAPGEHLSLLDLGTGTGAIALAIASECNHCDVLAVDSAPEAVALAEANRQPLGLENVRVQISDWFSQVSGRFHLIVSNPPYIDDADPHLSQGDVRFEPRSALVAADNGLADIKTIVARSPDYLHSGGYLLLEHGSDQGPAVRQLLSQRGFSSVSSQRDLAGHERVTGGRYHAVN